MAHRRLRDANTVLTSSLPPIGLWSKPMSRRLITFLGALMMFPSACLADIASFSSFSDAQLKESASELKSSAGVIWRRPANR